MKKLICFGMFFILSCSLLLSSCSNSDDEPEVQPAPAKNIEMTAAASRAAEEVSDFTYTFLAGMNKASYDLVFSDGKNEEGRCNVVVSPVQATMNLPIYNCIYGLPEEMFGFLGCSDIAALDELNQAYMEQLPALDPLVNVTLANSIWSKPGFELTPEQHAMLEEKYKAEFFDYNAATAHEDINKWFERVLPEGAPLVAENPFKCEHNSVGAMYFAGKWKFPFERAKTYRGNFKVAPGIMVTKTDFMHDPSLPARVGRTESFTAVAMDFGSGAYEAVFVLPERRGLAELNRIADSSELAQLSTLEFENSTVDLTLPRLHMGNNNELSIFEAAEAWGVKGLENIDADHRSFCKQSYKIYIEEDGAKVIVSSVGPGAALADRTIELVFDRPFFALIRAKQTGACIFAGKICYPQNEDEYCKRHIEHD